MLTWNPVLRPTGGGFTLVNQTIGGGPALNSGFEQVVPTMNARWRASLTLSVKSTAEIFALRGLIFGLGGRSGTIGVPAFDRARAPWAIDSYGRPVNPRLARRKSLDGTPFADAPGLIDSLIVAKIDAASPVRASQIIVSITKGQQPTPGMFFSIGTHLHAVMSIDAVDGLRYAISITPLLRDAVAIGDVVNFTSPLCAMRLRSDDQGQDMLTALDQFKFASGTLTFEEVPVSS